MRQSWSVPVYEAAERWVHAALKRDDSLFTPGATVWSQVTIDDLYERFNLHPDESADRFEVKFKRQLAGAPDVTIELAGEVLYVALLVVNDQRGESKRRVINEVLSWLASPVEIPSDLAGTLDHGIAGTGLAFKTLRPFQLWFLIEFVRKWKRMPEAERIRALQDPWEFREILHQVPIERGYAQREALLHLVFPDTFEDSVSREHKKAIADTFADLVPDASANVDGQLLEIRRRLSEEYGADLNFYDPEIRPLWLPVKPDVENWGRFFEWGRLFYEDERFDEWERDYKFEIATKLRGVRDAIRAGGEDWHSLLKKAFGPPNNLTSWQNHATFVDWCAAHPDQATDALRRLWDESAPLLSRLTAFLSLIPKDAMRNPLQIMSFLMMATDVTRHPPLRATVLKMGYDLTGYPPGGTASDDARRYRYGLAFLGYMMAQARSRGIELRDSLDAQSFLWAVTNSDPPEEWPESDKRTLLEWRQGKPVSPGQQPTVPPLIDTSPRAAVTETSSLLQLADELMVSEEFLADTVALLRDRKQIIFYGPPGTGKTYTARKLAEHLAPDASRREVVQFHPSYSYEDFVQGYRPEIHADGSMRYALREGPLMRLAARATREPMHEHVLLIDEINRGNLPKVFGELLYLLEYRDQPATLMYQGEGEFRLPGNLLIIGTMNTADRSIGLIDAALRRRFHFVPLFPGVEPVDGLLRRWLEKHKPDMVEVADIVDRLNERLRRRFGRHLQLGHSYFLRRDLSQELLSRIWDYDVLPFLEDQLFGQEKELETFELHRLRESEGANDQAVGAPADEGEALEG